MTPTAIQALPEALEVGYNKPEIYRYISRPAAQER
jgi:hypothetical protein